jgi:hypothetical protein
MENSLCFWQKLGQAPSLSQTDFECTLIFTGFLVDEYEHDKKLKVTRCNGTMDDDDDDDDHTYS